MARGINKVILIGNVGADPKINATGGGSSVANVRLATSESWKDKQSGQTQERTEWHNLVFFGRVADVIRDYVMKGSKIYVEGRLQTRKWQDQGGADRYSTEVVCNEMQILSGGRQNQNQGQSTQGQPQQQQPQQANGNQPAYNQGPPINPNDQGMDMPYEFG